MRDIIVTQNTSLDGIFAPMDGWFDPTRSGADVLAAGAEHRETADALLVGRTTYAELEGFWPHQTDDGTGVADYLNRVAKYVVSSTLETVSWPNSTVLRGLDDVSALKQQAGRDIVVTGSASLVAQLQRAGLVDRYRLFVYPVAQGHGRRVFPDEQRTELELTDVRRFAEGVALLEYRVNGSSST